MEEKKFLNYEGLKFLWSKILEDYPNNQTLTAIINAIDESKADKSDVNALQLLIGDEEVSKQISDALALQKLFSGDYNDLKNKPNIIDNQSDSLEIVDVLGNVILRIDKDGIFSTQLFLNNQNINDIIFNIDYKKLLAFDINEIIFENELDEDTSTSAVLGIAVLNQMKLGHK